MKPRPFDYVRPDTVEEALEVLAEHGEDARVLAGGQTLIAMLNLRVVEPAVLVDITRIAELAEIRELPLPDPPPHAGEGEEGAGPQAGEGRKLHRHAPIGTAAAVINAGEMQAPPAPSPARGGGLGWGIASGNNIGKPMGGRAQRCDPAIAANGAQSPLPDPPPRAGEGKESEQAGEGKESRVEVGAAVTQGRLMAWPALAHRLPLLAAALPFVGHFQTRNKGTVCGSVAHADPSSEIPLSLALLAGEVVLRSRRGARVLPAPAFQLGMLSTAREPDELITAVRFPVVAGGVAFREVARRHGDFAIVAVAALAERDGGVRLGVAGMAERPAVRRIAAPDSLAMREAIGDLAWELEGYEDIHASARMRRDLLRRIAPVVAEEARRCAA